MFPLPCGQPKPDQVGVHLAPSLAPGGILTLPKENPFFFKCCNVYIKAPLISGYSQTHRHSFPGLEEFLPGAACTLLSAFSSSQAQLSQNFVLQMAEPLPPRETFSWARGVGEGRPWGGADKRLAGVIAPLPVPGQSRRAARPRKTCSCSVISFSENTKP